MGEEEYRDNIQASTVTAKLPDINTSKGKQIAKNMARRIAEGKMDIKSVPRSYQSYVQGELKGAMPTSEAINKVSRPVAVGLAATFAAPAIIGGAAAALLNPYVRLGLDILGSADGVRNLVSKNGVQKTYRLAKEGDTFGAIKSGVGDALDLAGGVGLATKGGKWIYNVGKITNRHTLLNRLFHPVESYKFAQLSKGVEDLVGPKIAGQAIEELKHTVFHNRPYEGGGYSFFNRAPAYQRLTWMPGEISGLGDLSATTDWSRAHELGHLIENAGKTKDYSIASFPIPEYRYSGLSVLDNPEKVISENFADGVANVLTKDGYLETSQEILNRIRQATPPALRSNTGTVVPSTGNNQRIFFQAEPVATRPTPTRPISEAERLGVPKGERNQPIRERSYDQAQHRDVDRSLRVELGESVETPWTEQQIKAEVDPTVKQTMIEVNKDFGRRVNDTHPNFFDDQDAIDAFNTKLQKYIDSLGEVEIHPAFKSKTVDGVQYQSPMVRAYRRYLIEQGVDAAQISHDDLAKFLTSQYTELARQQTGKAKGTMLFHGSGNYFDKFDLDQIGSYTGNSGAIGPGFYFTNYGAQYHMRRSPITGRAIEHNVQPYLINGIKSTPDGHVMQQKGILKDYSRVVTSDDITSAKSRQFPTMLFGDLTEHVPGMYNISGGYKSAYMYRGDDIKSVFPHPSLLQGAEDGTVFMLPRTFDRGRLNYRDGGVLQDMKKSKIPKNLNGGFLQYISGNLRPKFDGGGNVYTVKSGDNLSKIAKANGLSLKELLDLNPEYKADPNKIYVGQKVVVSYPDSEPTLQNLRTRRLQEAELNADNLSAILGARHDNTFAVIDKDKQVLTVYNKNGRIITSVPVNTGKSNDDYNTKTYLDEKGHLINMAGNNSTPAGITEITSIYDYQGAPSFQRARVGSDNKIKTVKDKKGRTVPDEVASSIHFERGVGSANSSNGCVRVTPEGAKILKNYLGVGSRIYTLPQHKESSRFVLNDGKLSYVADNVYGRQKGEEGNTTTVRGRVVDKHDWDDYNTTIDRTYSPLQIDVRDTDNKEYNTNKRTFAKSLEDNKEFVQKQLGLSSSEYNTLAMVAMGIADQESKFGTATSYKLKQNSAGVISALKRLKGEKTAQSQGVGQIKYGDDSAEAIAIYDKLGVTDNHNDIANEAKAIIGRLYHIYRNQYQNAKSWYTKAGLSTEQALAYIYNGGNFNEIKQVVNDGIQLSDKRISMSSSPLMRLLGIKDAKVSRQNYADNVVAKIDSSDYIGYVKQGGLLRFCATGGTIQKYDGGGPTKKKSGTRTTVISNRAESSNARTHRLGSKFFTASYSDLPVEGKRIINELCKELNIPTDRVEESYNSGRLDKVIAARYKVENPEEARVRENDSPTKKTSEEYEARMNNQVYHGANYVAPNMPYAIPYLEEKEIKVPGVGRVSTNALDSLAKYAAITDTPLSDALGLAAQETAFGALPVMNYTDDDSVDNRALGNSSYFRNYGEIPAENFVRDFRYNSKKPGDKPIDRSVPPLQHAFEYFKKGNYNRGDKNHTSDVKAKGREVMKTKAIQDWIANSEFAQKALRKTTKRSQGGLLKYVSGNI